jgi:hypothetical protein
MTFQKDIPSSTADVLQQMRDLLSDLANEAASRGIDDVALQAEHLAMAVIDVLDEKTN